MRIGAEQAAGLEVYVFDPCVVEGREAMGERAFPGRVVGGVLEVDDEGEAAEQLTEAANSADADAERLPGEGFGKVRDALTALAVRCRR